MSEYPSEAFKAGDRVRCIDTEASPLTLHALYTVTRVAYNGDVYVKGPGQDTKVRRGAAFAWSPSRFDFPPNRASEFAETGMLGVEPIFSPDDVVTCTASHGEVPPGLDPGAVYTVRDVMVDRDGWTKVRVGNFAGWYRSKHFALLASTVRQDLPKMAPAETLAVVQVAETLKAIDDQQTGDPVNLPPHYARFPIEPLRFIMENNLSSLEGKVIKYMLRAPYKGKQEEDMEKATRCLRMLTRYRAGDPDWWKREEPGNG